MLTCPARNPLLAFRPQISVKRVLVFSLLVLFLVTVNWSVAPAAYAATNELFFIHQDHLGSTTAITDESGDVVQQTRSFPYGTERINADLDRIITERSYTAQIRDNVTSLYYYKARYYDSVLGTFVSADTVNDGVNRFSYVAGNPISNKDPSGNRILRGDPLDRPDPIGGVPSYRKVIGTQEKNPYEQFIRGITFYQQERDMTRNIHNMCGPTSTAIVLSQYFFGNKKLEPMDVAQDMIEEGLFSYSGGTTTFSIEAWLKRNYEDFQPELRYAPGGNLMQVANDVNEYGPVIFPTQDINVGGPHLVVFLGLSDYPALRTDSELMAVLYDPNATDEAARRWGYPRFGDITLMPVEQVSNWFAGQGSSYVIPNINLPTKTEGEDYFSWYMEELSNVFKVK